MSTKLENFKKEQLKTDIPDVSAGDTVRILQKIDGKNFSFEGLIIARKHGSGPSATITVRKVIDKVGVERVFPVHSPTIEKIEVLKKGKVRRAKIYYIREKSRRVARRKIK